MKYEYHYSNKAVRFYSHKTDQDDIFKVILDFWQEFDKKSVTMFHTKDFSVVPTTGKWSISPQSSVSTVQQLVNPNFRRISSNKLVELSFSDNSGGIKKIESPLIDIDFERQCLLVWTTTPFELYIFDSNLNRNIL